MPRGLDHVVHAVRDLDAAADLYRRLGFTVGARNRHPWGTHNHIIQLPGFFIELLTVAEPGNLGEDVLSQQFGRFNQGFLRRHEGFSLLILESPDAVTDAAALRSAGIGASGAIGFEREGRRPNGAVVKVGFSLAFARDPLAPATGFAVCQQHFPENFWNPAFQRHDNGATAVAGAVLVAENPADHHIFLSALVGVRDMLATSTGITFKTPRGEIQVMDETAYRRHFAVPPPDIGRGARIAALRIAARDIRAVFDRLRVAAFEPAEIMGRVVVAPARAMGAALVFEAA
jgi:hypothetical protein